MKTSEFNYELPAGLIAQEPLAERSNSRLMVVDRASGRFEHRHVFDLPEYLNAGDLLVVNNTRVIHARVFGRRPDTGGRVELLLVERVPEPDPGQQVAAACDVAAGRGEVWDVFYRASGRPRCGLILEFAGGRLRGEVVALGANGRVLMRLEGDRPVIEILEDEGFAPVPPYIHRPAERSRLTDQDRRTYQTVYARHSGAVAAPTAGLHFTPELFDRLAAQGVKRTELTLHVGPGTFKPVKTELVEDHVMEAERFEIGAEAAEAIGQARRAGGRIVAVGSTSVRTLETVAGQHGCIVACSGRTSLFIHPPYQFKAVDVMITNFHVPESSLLMMVSALAGRELLMRAYREAVERKYRFYSYGDCMLIL